MKKAEEKILLFNFEDSAYQQQIEDLLAELKITTVSPGIENYNQRVGYLFGLKGFSQAEPATGTFEFGYCLMMFLNFTQERLMKVLATMRERGITVPACKSVVTPTNRFWTLAHVCEQMEKEHLEMQRQRQANK